MGMFYHVLVCLAVLPFITAWSTRGASVEQKVEELATQQMMWNERTNSFTQTVMSELTVLDKKVKQTNGELNEAKTELGGQIRGINQELSTKTDRLDREVTQNGERARSIADAFTKVTSVLGAQVKNVEEKGKSLEEEVRKQAEKTEAIAGQIEELTSEGNENSPIEVARLRQSVSRVQADMARLQQKYEGDLDYVREALEELKRSVGMFTR